jgi:Uma2 family endonuclease
MSTAAPTTVGLMTAEEFFAWSQRPENADRHCELEDGRIVDMPQPGDLHGVICSWIARLLWDYCIARGGGRVNSNDVGVRVRPNSVQGADVMLFDTGYAVGDLNTGYPTDIPTLVVEVFSPSDRPGRLNRRIARYHAHGIPLVWVVYPEDFQVDAHRPNQAVQTFDLGDTLHGFAELPGFTTPVAALFTLPGQQPPTATP